MMISFILNIIVAICAMSLLVLGHTNPSYSTEKIRACFRYQKEHCSDLICEMSTDEQLEIIQQVETNILDCLEQKRPVSEP